jgi:HrpA-like RNA helicase
VPSGLFTGRESDGKAYRLYTEATFQALPATQEPEIKRSNLGAVVLQLKALGVPNPTTFDFLDPPSRPALLRALELLLALGAVGSDGELTKAIGTPICYTLKRALCLHVVGSCC